MNPHKALRIASPIAAVLLFITLIVSSRRGYNLIPQALLTADNASCRCKNVERTAKADHRMGPTKVPQTDWSFLFKREMASVCSNENCASDYERHFPSQSESPYPIPAVRHILWRNESVSKYFAEQLSSWHKIHADWTFILWRDQDLEPFVRAHFPGLLAKFRSLPQQIMRVDMVRYMLLFKFGGVYADLDYSLVRGLDRFRRFHAVITREADAHSLCVYGLSWPVKPLANPAFMMSAPGHAFFHFAMHQLESKDDKSGPLYFAGPFGLTDIMERYQRVFPIASSVMETVYVPPSYSFYSYPDNRLNNSGSIYIGVRVSYLKSNCASLTSNSQLRGNINLKQYCLDVNNMDPITDRTQPIIAIHDMMKLGTAYDGIGNNYYTKNLVDVRKVVGNIKFGRDFL